MAIFCKGDLKGCTEALLCSAQEQALKTNHTEFHIDKNTDKNFATKEAWKEMRNGTNSNPKQLLKMRISSSYGISPFSLMDLWRQGDEILYW